MIIRSLKLFSFRNLIDQELQFSSGINLLFGRNAQGKTNFVEAIHILGAGKSFQTSKLKECIRFDQPSCSVFGQIYRERSDAEFELGVTLEVSNKARYLYNGEKVSLARTFLGRLIPITFSPADLAIVQGPPAERRRFIDRHMSELSPPLFAALINYQKALRAKQQLLRDEKTPMASLDPWNQILAEHAHLINQGRLEFLKKLQNAVSSIVSLVAPQDGAIELTLRNKGANEGLHSQEDWQQLFNKFAPRELAAQSTLVGAHLDEISFQINELAARDFASQGQARSLVLSLKLGVVELIEATLGESPVVVLDDVNSELDAGRALNVFGVFLKAGRQIFATSIEGQSNPWKEAKKFEVKSGLITAV